jgi:hypothetical protein
MLQGITDIGPFINNTIFIYIDSELRLLLLKYIFSYLLSHIYNNGDGCYKEIEFTSSK